jgi:hypothetical protein
VQSWCSRGRELEETKAAVVCFEMCFSAQLFAHRRRTRMSSSCGAIHAALVRSRQLILTDALPPFSTKSRSKAAQLVQPLHTLAPLATTTVAVGPHSFTKTKLFTVEWGAVPKKKTSAQSPLSPGTTAPAALSPALIFRLNVASASDPLLSSILLKAGKGEANPQELAGLARYIEALRKDEDGLAPPPPSAPIASTSDAVAEYEQPSPPSIVIEFRESSSDRFILPSHFTYTPIPSDPPMARQAVLLSFFVFPVDKGKGKKKDEESGTQGLVPVPMSLVVEDCTEAVRNSLRRASRTGRERDLAVEEWWASAVSFPFLPLVAAYSCRDSQMMAVVPRVSIVHTPRLPSPEPVVLPVLSRATSFIGGPLVSASVGSTSRGSSPALSKSGVKPKRVQRKRVSHSPSNLLGTHAHLPQLRPLEPRRPLSIHQQAQ